jgi:hypothetical protein
MELVGEALALALMEHSHGALWWLSTFLVQLLALEPQLGFAHEVDLKQLAQDATELESSEKVCKLNGAMQLGAFQRP